LVDLLDSVERHPNFAIGRVAAYTGVNYTVAMRWLMELNDRGFINIVTVGNSNFGKRRKVNLTTKGKNWLRKVITLIEECGIDFGGEVKG